MKSKLIGIFVILALMLAPQFGQAQGSRRAVAIVYQGPDQKLLDFDLVKRLSEELSIRGDLKVIDYTCDSLMPHPPNDRFRMEELFQWGREIGTRYIIYLHVDRRILETRKRVSIPLLLSRYIIEGRIGGNYMLLDLSRNRLTATWDLKTKMTGPRQWQIAQDYPDDPDLFLSAPRKALFFEKLEAKAAVEIFKNVRLHLKGR